MECWRGAISRYTNVEEGRVSADGSDATTGPGVPKQRDMRDQARSGHLPLTTDTTAERTGHLPLHLRIPQQRGPLTS
jgi:hypothetical protein